MSKIKPTIDDLIAAVLVFKEARDEVDRIKKSLTSSPSSPKPRPPIQLTAPNSAKSFSISMAAIAAAFGGFSQLAEALESSLSTVHGWHRRGGIPHYRHKAIRDAAAARGIDLSLLPRQPNKRGLPVGKAIKDLEATLPTSPKPDDLQADSLDPGSVHLKEGTC